MRGKDGLQKDMATLLDKDDKFYYHGYTGTHFFKSWEEGKDKHPIDSKKPHGDKTNISFEIYIYPNRYEEHEKHGIEFKIDMYMWGFQSDETVFQGWAESVEEFKTILKAVGL